MQTITTLLGDGTFAYTGTVIRNCPKLTKNEKIMEIRKMEKRESKVKDLVKKDVFDQVGTTGKGTYYLLKETKGT